jgi:predicted ATPase
MTGWAEVDDGQSALAQRCAIIRPNTGIVRTAVNQCIGHGLDRTFTGVRRHGARPVDHASKTTHQSLLTMESGLPA